MKSLFVMLTLIFTTEAFALKTEVDVISVEFGVEDHFQRKSLCLTVVRVPYHGALLGVVEDIESCTYARSAKKSYAHKIHIELHKLKKITVPELKDHLQKRDTQLSFYFSPGE
ncbi:MAG TPA: hypothetical protein VNJ01_07985 [Bacteriovoracaceae bacterium]|nr:hypothetical protein [Bacteriovoracaceae bacterium]